jgi:hypothetical protein
MRDWHVNAVCHRLTITKRRTKLKTLFLIYNEKKRPLLTVVRRALHDVQGRKVVNYLDPEYRFERMEYFVKKF